MSTKKTAATAAKETEITDDSPKIVADDAIIEDEIERIVPVPGEPIRLEDGTFVKIRPLKLKELFAAFKIITRGSAAVMGSLDFGALDQEDFSNTLIALLVTALPEAPEEFSEFLRISVDPVAPDGKWKSTQEQIEAESHLDEILFDPEITDAIDIVSAIIYAESRDIQRLGKKVSNAIQLFQKVEPKTKK